MAVPKRKKSKARVGMRKSANMAYAKKPVHVVEDATTGEQTRSHHITADGFYKGRNIFEKPASA